MAAKPMSEALMREAYEAVQSAGSVAVAAERLGIPRGTLTSRYQAAKARRAVAPKIAEIATPQESSEDAEDRKSGTRVIDCRMVGISSLEEALERFEVDLAVWEVERYTINAWGSASKEGDAVLHQVKVWLRRIVSAPVEDAAAILAARIRPAPVVRGRRARPEGRLVVTGQYDVHLGQLVSPSIVRGQRDNLALTVERSMRAVDAIVARIEPERPGRVIVPIGHDFVHFENDRAETASGKHAVDYAAVYPEIIVAAHDLLAYQADAFLSLGCEVEFIHVPCNHAPIAGFHLAHWLAARYRTDGRVSVDTEYHKFKFRTVGNILLGFCHGHHMKIDRLYEVMTEEAGDDWAGKAAREWHTGHLHTRESRPARPTSSKSASSVMIRQNPSLSMTSGYAHGLGFVGHVPGVSAWIYDQQSGYSGELCEHIN